MSFFLPTWNHILREGTTSKQLRCPPTTTKSLRRTPISRWTAPSKGTPASYMTKPTEASGRLQNCLAFLAPRSPVISAVRPQSKARWLKKIHDGLKTDLDAQATSLADYQFNRANFCVSDCQLTRNAPP